MPDRALPTLLPWQIDVLNRLRAGQEFVITVPRGNGRASFLRWVQNWGDVHALVFLKYLEVWNAPGGMPELEPPRRPPSWYPGQPEPPKPRRRACTCFYGLRIVPDAPDPWVPVKIPGTLRTEWYTRCFVIVFDCPHHGDDRLEEELALDEAYPDGGVWGFTLDDC